MFRLRATIRTNQSHPNIWDLPAGAIPTTDEAGFLEFVRSLRSSALIDAIAGAEPLAPVHNFLRMRIRLRHHEDRARWLVRVVVIGDAVCGFNPVYGQGMAIAAIDIGLCPAASLFPPGIAVWVALGWLKR
jgi:2-polyprenyl-6-methoxyphenol hydroxylase-like FAD-dependent oxidoreductase